MKNAKISRNLLVIALVYSSSQSVVHNTLQLTDNHIVDKNNNKPNKKKKTKERRNGTENEKRAIQLIHHRLNSFKSISLFVLLLGYNVSPVFTR